MQRIVFYSWQSDLPNKTNRGFIQQALENAASRIVKDTSVEVEPVIDRDTQGIAGSPDIATTIFSKIAASDIFVADISIINQNTDSRHTPNPNVLIELGYALRSLGFERVILTFNLAYGKLESLPFDLRMRRIMTYNVPENAENKADERKNLEKNLENAIRSALDHAPVEEQILPILTSLQAIENSQPNKLVALRKDLQSILRKIETLAPKTFSAGGSAEELMTAIDATQELVADFSKISEIIVLMKDKPCLLEVYHWLGQVFEKYNTASDYQGRITDGDYDYFRFLGHEMLVSIYAFLLKEQDWDLIKILLVEAIPVSFLRERYGPADVSYTFAAKGLKGLDDEQKKLNKISIHGYLLNLRHTDGGLSAIMPMNLFSSADLFLFLHHEFTFKGNFYDKDFWLPWSVIYLKAYPPYLARASRKDHAKILVEIFNLESIEQLKEKLPERILSVRELFGHRGMIDLPVRNADFKNIGSI